MDAVTVVGDSLLDADIDGEARGLSPEAPVPTIDVDTIALRPGGAALVAKLLALDGIAVTLVTRLASDRHARLLEDLLPGVDVVATRDGTATPIKARVRSGRHTVTRLDIGCSPWPAHVPSADMIEAIIASHCVIVSDYGRGVAEAAAVRMALSRVAPDVPIVWDPHARGPRPVRGVALAVPNSAEASAALGRPLGDARDALRAAEQLRKRWSAEATAITRGPLGAVLSISALEGSGSAMVIPAGGALAADACGAGDRLAATAAVSLARGESIGAALRTAVADATAFVERGAASSVSAAGVSHDALPLESGARAQHDARTGATLVATGGCFDILHAGHVRTLEAARGLGDRLVVCINSDDSARRVKGPGRPIMNQEDRAALLRSLECVDEVVVFDEDTPNVVLQKLRPDIWVKGGDYLGAHIDELDTMLAWGGTVVTVPYMPAVSTTALANALASIEQSLPERTTSS